MYIPKKIGKSRIDNCPFCDKQSTTTNEQGLYVCKVHKSNLIQDLKCLCGDYLDILEGKWGPYCRCIKCGNMNMKKALELNPDYKDNIKVESKIKTNIKSSNNFLKKKTKKYNRYRNHTPTETVVRSDELDFM